MQIFAFSNCPDFRSLLEVECKELTGIRPVIHDSFMELKNILSIFQSIDVLIIDSPEDVRGISELENFLCATKGKVRNTLVFGGEKTKREEAGFFSRMEVTELFDSLKLLIQPHGLQESEWSAIPLCTLIHFQSLPFDLYLKLSDKRFVRRIPAYEALSGELIDSLFQKGMTDLYCEKRFKRDFSMMLINNMINKVDRGYENIQDQLIAHDEVYKTTKEIVQNLGLSGRVTEVCETSIDKMSSEVFRQPGELRTFLIALKTDKNLAFHFKLIQLSNYIGAQLIQDMELPLFDEQVEKFIWANFFCDIPIKNPALHYHRKAGDAGALSLEEQNEVNFHALKAAEIISNYKKIPNEVRLMVLQHHGSFSGIGFPPDKSTRLLPLSKILIVSQDLAFSILTNEEIPALEILKGFLNKSSSSGLQELLQCLEKLGQESEKAA